MNRSPREEMITGLKKKEDESDCQEPEDDPEPMAIDNKAFGKCLKFRPVLQTEERPDLPKKRGYFFRFHNGADVKLVRHTLEYNGFRENNSNRNPDWTIMWSNSNYKSQIYQQLGKF